MRRAHPPHVVIVGSGFGGLFAARELKSADVRITVIARTTHHLFQPLLYQVATGILSEGEIAPATREILKRQRNVRVLLGDVDDIDLASRFVSSRYHDQVTRTPYDHLVVAAGAGQSYFGNDHFATFAPGMKTIDDALELRSRIFGAFEMAEMLADTGDVSHLLTFVVVGAGPTGVEMAGQIRELASKTLAHDFRRIDPTSARVILVDGAPQVLPTFGDLGQAAKRSLRRLGVEVILGAMVTDIDDASVEIKHADGRVERIRSICKVWAAGVQASSLGRTLSRQSGAELDRAGRVRVQPDLTLPGHPEVFVIGDMAFVDGGVGGVPGVAQGAIQGAQYAASRIRETLQPTATRQSSGTPEVASAGVPTVGGPVGERTAEPVAEPFRYRDKGSMATISKYSAVVSVGRLHVTGFIAWLMWLVLHLLYIAGFKHRVTTLLHWIISFLGSARSERTVTEQQLLGRLALSRIDPLTTGELIRGREASGERANEEPRAAGDERAGSTVTKQG